MAKRRIGLDIGSTAVRAAELSVNGGRPALVRIAQVPIAPGAVANGEIRDPGLVTEALKELWRQGRFKGREVMLGVGNQRVVVRDITLPWLPEKELRASLPFQVQEHVPIAVEDAVLDYHIVEELEVEGRRTIRLLLVAAHRGMVEQFVEAIEGAKLVPAGLDLIPFAITRSVGSVDGVGLGPESEGDEAIVDVGAEVTSICIHASGLPRFVRILATGGRDITSAVARSVGVPPEEAEAMKRGVSNGHAPEQVSQVAVTVSNRAASLVDEIRSSLDFFESQVQGADIKRVFLTGGGSRLNGLVNLLDERLPAQVQTGHPFHRVDVELNMDQPELAAAEPLLAVAVGLALPGGEE